MKLWKKIFIGFIIFLVITYSATYLTLRRGQTNFRQSEPYKTAVRYAADNDDINKEVGQIVKIDDGGGSLYSDSARIGFKVEGFKKKVFVICTLTKSSDGPWSVVAFSYRDYKE